MTALAAAEARLLTRMPAVWGGFLLTLALCTVWSLPASRTWWTFTTDSGRAALVLAGVLLLLGHLAASRDHRHGAAEVTRTFPSPPWRRVAALVALVPLAGAAGVAAEGVELLILSPSGLTGHLDPWLLAVPVVVPMIGAALGVAAGLWWPATPGGPLVLFAAAAALAVLPVVGSTPQSLAWRLFPVVMNTSADTAAVAWHVLYLVAALAAALGAVLARHRRLTGAAVMVLALATAVAATPAGRR